MLVWHHDHPICWSAFNQFHQELWHSKAAKSPRFSTPWLWTREPKRVLWDSCSASVGYSDFTSLQELQGVHCNGHCFSLPLQVLLKSSVFFGFYWRCSCECKSNQWPQLVNWVPVSLEQATFHARTAQSHAIHLTTVLSILFGSCDFSQTQSLLSTLTTASWWESFPSPFPCVSLHF
jgi:hypothetical protein